MPTDVSEIASNPNSLVMQLGVGGIFALLIIGKVFDFLKTKRPDSVHEKIARQINDLHDWHDVHDADGAKIWYVKRSLEKAISKLSDNLEAQTRVLQNIAATQERILDRSPD